MKLSEVIFTYVSYKRAIGYRYKSEEAIFRYFLKAVGDKPIKTITADAVRAFLNSNGSGSGYCLKKYHVLSGFYRFSIVRGLTNKSPLPPSAPKPTGEPFVPYIYSHEELKRLIEAVPTACARRTPIEELVLRTLLLFLYGTGLRIGEALGLTMNDVHLSQAFLHIRKTKFFKSRLVPMGRDLAEILEEYVSVRHKGNTEYMEMPLFCFYDGTPLSQSATRNAFRRLRTHAGIMRSGGPRRQPRLHDIRHTAAVHRLIAWYQSGADIQELLPKLATYLGHSDLSSTQHYLTMTPDLLRQASKRFEYYAIGGET